MGKRTEATLTEQLTDTLRKEIRSGRFGAGQAIPSESELCRKYKVSRVTVRRGLALLKSERLLESRPGVGHFVSASSNATHASDASRTEVLYVHDVGKANHGLGSMAAEIFSGAISEAGQHGLDVFQCCLDSARLRELVEAKAESTLRGVLFDWNDPDMARFMIERRVPFVIVEGDFDELPVGAVVQDDAGGTISGLQHLWDHGHRRIAYLGYDDSWIHRKRRSAAFREFHLRQGVKLSEELLAFASFDGGGDGSEEAARLLSLPQRPTAIYAANRELLNGLFAAADRFGLSVPGDLGALVWGEPSPGDAHAEVDFISWDREEMGRMALRMVEDRAARGVNERMQVLIPAKLNARGSVSRPKGDAK